MKKKEKGKRKLVTLLLFKTHIFITRQYIILSQEKKGENKIIPKNRRKRKAIKNIPSSKNQRAVSRKEMIHFLSFHEKIKIVKFTETVSFTK